MHGYSFFTIFTGAFCEHGNIVARSHAADDGCVIMPCLNSGTCIPQGSKYECKCSTGFTGRNCEMTMKLCNSSPCHHSMSCRDFVSFYMSAIKKIKLFNQIPV